MQAAIVSVGTELVTGQCVDTNSAWLSAELARDGIRVVLHTTVGDELPALDRAIRQALESAELVILTGGLGPTEDDLTRQGVALAIDAELEESAEACDQIRAHFQRWGRPMPVPNLRQALLPHGCQVLLNTRGTAPGIGWRRGDRRLFALPGVPREMKTMYETCVRPILREAGGGACIDSLCLRCFGVSEAVLGERIKDLMIRGRNPEVGTTVSEAVLTVRIVARGAEATVVRRLLAQDAAEIRARLGDCVFGEGEETLQASLARALTEARLTLSTAESCTGGLLAKRLTDLPGSSAYFLRGYVVYSNEAKTQLLGVSPALLEREGAVSETAAKAMAEGCRAASGSATALAVTGIAGPSGGSPPEKPVGLVFIALADSQGTEARRFLFGEWLTRAEIRDRAVKTAMNWLRLRLLGGDR